jgi:ATP/maltotriose-dependent transcriptional regulator MalT
MLLGATFTLHLVRHAGHQPHPHTESGSEILTPEISRPESAAAFFERYNITPRDQEIIGLILQGCRNQEIADQLFISLTTVKTHLRNIYGKLGINNRYKLIALYRNAIVPPEHSAE